VSAARVYGSANATARLPERNWSRWGNLYDENRYALDILKKENDAEQITGAEDEELLFSSVRQICVPQFELQTA
jgi:hypothetical protein